MGRHVCEPSSTSPAGSSSPAAVTRLTFTPSHELHPPRRLADLRAVQMSHTDDRVELVAIPGQDVMELQVMLDVAYRVVWLAPFVWDVMTELRGDVLGYGLPLVLPILVSPGVMELSLLTRDHHSRRVNLVRLGRRCESSHIAVRGGASSYRVHARLCSRF